MTAVAIDVADAQDALAAADDGDKELPGDRHLIDAYEGHCQQGSARFWQALWLVEDAAERTEWLASQCRYCGPEGATGDDCGDCPEGTEAAA